MNGVFVKSYPPPSVDEEEIYRYMRAGRPSEDVRSLVRKIAEEMRSVLKYRVCFTRLPLLFEEGKIDFGQASTDSKDLAKRLFGCDEAIVFASTVGVEADRIIRKYKSLSPLQGLAADAVGSERAEALCDEFCRDMSETLAKEGISLVARFSPGYGDLPLEFQKTVFKMLECDKKIGLTLTDSLLMTPTKSVSAIIGLTKSNRRGEVDL